MAKKHPRVTIRQIGGDDGFQWCVLIDGRVKWNGMTRSEASWRAKREIDELAKPTIAPEDRGMTADEFEAHHGRKAGVDDILAAWRRLPTPKRGG